MKGWIDVLSLLVILAVATSNPLAARSTCEAWCPTTLGGGCADLQGCLELGGNECGDIYGNCDDCGYLLYCYDEECGPNEGYLECSLTIN